MLVFDLDGTLIDSSQDLCNSVNAALGHVDRLPLPMDQITGFIGDGAATLVRRSLSASQGRVAQGVMSEPTFDSAFSFFLDYYRTHKLDHTKTYLGVLEALQSIRNGYPLLPMAILTNKPVRPSREICAALGLSPYFFAVYGGDSFVKKPDPAGLRAIIAEANGHLTTSNPEAKAITPDQVVMIGDSEVDVETARRCGARSLGCRYGVAPVALAAASPDLMVEGAKDWAEALGLLGPANS